jgi:thiol-disulfide isomerase/thioredoxin
VGNDVIELLRAPGRVGGTVRPGRMSDWRNLIRRAATVVAIGALVGAAASACGSSRAAPARAGTCLASPSATTAGQGGETSTAPLPTASGGAATASTKLRLPSQSVDCLDGSGAVRLDTLDRPAVVNLWASYCLPCHAELPHLEAFAQAAGSSLAVIGVDTADERGAAMSVVHDLGLTYPMVFDPKQRIYTATAGRGLPATLFVAPGGSVRYVYESGTILDTARLAQLAQTYLGVTVRG